MANADFKPGLQIRFFFIQVQVQPILASLSSSLSSLIEFFRVQARVYGLIAKLGLAYLYMDCIYIYIYRLPNLGKPEMQMHS